MDRRKFLTYVGCTCCSLALNSCTTAPITERKQLKLISEAKLNAQAAKLFEQIKEKQNKEGKLITGPKLNQIKEIGKKMENSIGEYFYRSKLDDPTDKFDWEYILIDKKNKRNAFCLPGGKIAVYSGIFEVTKNIDGLAAVMGHEVAHAVAKHSVERVSRAQAVKVGTYVIDIFSGGILSEINNKTTMNTTQMISQLGIMNPFNRKQETEADYLGMIFASLSGYDIRETPKIWERLKKFNKGKTQSEFFSTHPSYENRIKKINEWTNNIILDYPPIKI